MLLVLLNWAYIGITAFLAGFAVLAPFGRKISEKETGYVCRTGTGVLMAGLAFITVYAQVFSLFQEWGFGQMCFCFWPVPSVPFCCAGSLRRLSWENGGKAVRGAGCFWRFLCC